MWHRGVALLGDIENTTRPSSPSWIGRDGASAPSIVRSGRRRTTGTFYTPRSLTEYMVRRTLAPLVAGATPEEILRLRVLDPAMGSGAFLVAACRYLALAYERALIGEGGLSPAHLYAAPGTAVRRSSHDRLGARRARIRFHPSQEAAGAGVRRGPNRA